MTTPSDRTTEVPAPVLSAALIPDNVVDRRASGTRGSAPSGQDGTSVVSRADSIESVRILRSDERPTAEQPASEPPPDARGRAAKTKEPASNGQTTADRHTTADRQQNLDAGTAPSEESFSNGPDNGAAASQERDVQGLFARIRASRAQATTEARTALADDDQGLGTGANTDGTPNVGAGQGLDLAVGAPAVVAGAAPTSDGDVGLGTGTDLAAEDQVGGHGQGAERARDRFFEGREEVTGHLESSLARKLKRALQDEQNSILDRLRNLKSSPTPANVLPNAEEQPDRFVEAGRPLLEEAARAGAALAATLCGEDVPQPEPGQEQVEDLAEELGRAIAEPLRQRLELAFRSSDEDPAELADVLGAAYREWKTQRIEAAAHDQVAAAFARGAYLAFPQGTLLNWVVDPSEGPCPDCEDNELAGAQGKGEVWPTGQLCPPAHPGCRCALAPTELAPDARVGATPLPASANTRTD
jgi:hypothetical protein